MASGWERLPYATDYEVLRRYKEGRATYLIRPHGTAEVPAVFALKPVGSNMDIASVQAGQAVPRAFAVMRDVLALEWNTQIRGSLAIFPESYVSAVALLRLFISGGWKCKLDVPHNEPMLAVHITSL